MKKCAKNMFRMMLFYLFLLKNCFKIEAYEYAEVTTSVGTIRGITDDFQQIKFLGVPYGFVDEKHPFEPATPYPPFNSTFNATTYAVQCPQYHVGSGRVVGDINCLNLNIYKPKSKPGELLPVMIYVYGGEFMYDDGNDRLYDPRFLVEKGIIFVSMNYRLGIFGFVCVKNQFENKYTNQGLKDQLLAIEWVKKNIQYFGGDVNNIVLNGHSSGSCCVDNHLLFSEIKGINKYILGSGNAGPPMGIVEGTPIEEIKDLLHFTFQNKSDIYHAIERTRDWNFGLCRDGDLITQQPKIKSMKNIQILTGDVDLEMAHAFKDKNITFFENYSLSSDLSKAFIKTPVAMSSDVEFIKKSYGIDKDPFQVIKFTSDFFLSYKTEKGIRYYLSKNATVRSYHFSYMGNRNFMKILKNLTTTMTTHADELGYIFDSKLIRCNRYLAEDYKVLDVMTTLWTDFTKFGNIPSWPPTLIDNRRTLLIKDHKPFMVQDDKYRFAALDTLYINNYEYDKSNECSEME